MNSRTALNNAINAKNMMVRSTSEQRRETLKYLAENLRRDKNKILKANKKDMQAARHSYDEAFLDRMSLSESGFEAMLKQLEGVLALDELVGELYDSRSQESGIETAKMRVPIGIILMVYESRPNVTVDAAALSLKTANTIILKGGSEIKHTNRAFEAVIGEALEKAALPSEAVQILTSDSRIILSDLLSCEEIDLLIPRGSRRLLDFIRKKSHIPMLMHLEGNCHVYVDKEADIKIAEKVVVDSKTQRLGTCNTAESLVIHKDISRSFLLEAARLLAEHSIEIRGDQAVCKIVKFARPAGEADWSREYLAPVISIKIVSSVEEAISHINKYGSGHTDSVITKNQTIATKFLKEVDSASVMLNTSTRFADGFEYGLGAEIGISTNKLHARGPVGQEGLLTYKWIVKSNGATKGDIVNS